VAVARTTVDHPQTGVVLTGSSNRAVAPAGIFSRLAGEESMMAFRVLLVAMWMVIAAYTAVVVMNHGPDLLTVFFADMRSMGWPGQFNLDFMFMLTLSGLWVTWRHRFSARGIGLGLLAFFGGAFFLCAYLLFLSLQSKGDVREMLVGKIAG